MERSYGLDSLYNETFENEEVHLDGKEVENCTFRRCTLVYSGGPLRFGDNRMQGCTYEFDGAAERTLAFMTMIYHQGAKELIEHTFSNIRRGSHPNPPGR